MLVTPGQVLMSCPLAAVIIAVIVPVMIRILLGDRFIDTPLGLTAGRSGFVVGWAE